MVSPKPMFYYNYTGQNLLISANVPFSLFSSLLFFLRCLISLMFSAMPKHSLHFSFSVFVITSILYSSTTSSASGGKRRATPPSALHQPTGGVFKQWEVGRLAQTTTLSPSDVGGGNRSSNSEHSPAADNTQRGGKEAAKVVVVNKRREVKEFVGSGGGDVKEEVAAGTVTLPDGGGAPVGVGRVDDGRSREDSNRMVAACVEASSATVTTAATHFNHHNHTGLASGFGGAGGGGRKNNMETNSNPPTAPKGVTMSTAGVDQLRQQLQSVVENGDLTASNACVEQLENAVLSKDTLEATRVGRFVNDVRKRTATQWPDFSKRCRALIKQWQKVAEYRPGSSCGGSSNGGTPQLVSPALKHGLTPRAGALTTPGKRATPQQQQQRAISAGLCHATAATTTEDSHKQTGRWSSTLSSSVSPVENGVPTAASGSYAPLSSTTGKKTSPLRQSVSIVQQHHHSMHKSASVGAALSCFGGSSTAKRTVPLLNGVTEGGVTVAGEAHLAASSYADVTKEVGAVQPPPMALTAPSGPSTSNPPLTLKLKRSASGMQRLTSSLSPPVDNGIAAAASTSTVDGQQSLQQQQSVLAARKNVQSTAQLMAQLSMALPQNIGIDLSNKLQQQQSQQQQTVGPAVQQQKVVAKKVSSEPIPTSAEGIKRRHQKRKGGTSSEEGTDATLAKQLKGTNNTGETLTGVKEQDDGQQREANWKQQKAGEEEDNGKKTTSDSAISRKEEEKGKEGKKGRKKKRNKQQPDDEHPVDTKFNWFAEFPFGSATTTISTPPVEGGQPAAATDGIPAQVYASPTRSFVLPAHERNVLLLPYMDIGLPDWRVHNFPQTERFLFPESDEWHKRPF